MNTIYQVIETDGELSYSKSKSKNWRQYFDANIKRLNTMGHAREVLVTDDWERVERIFKNPGSIFTF